MAYKDYRDPLNGFIGLSEAEQIIVDSEPFQRLRNIKQLGTTYLVYPTANHTRFEHSLGTLESATRLFDALVSNPDNRNILEWAEVDIVRYRKFLKVARIKWGLLESLYRNEFQAFTLPQLEWLQTRLQFEMTVEGRIISPLWYQIELIVKVIAEKN